MTRIRRLGLRAGATVVALCALAVASVTATGTPHSTRFYLALGDSLSTGFQPTLAGDGINTGSGYVNDLWRYEHRRIRRLGLVDVGCPGDTTTSLLTGTGNDALARRLHCDRSHGSQLAAAIAFLRAHHHPGEVPVITIDIGINDLNRCADLLDPRPCLAAGEQQISAQLPRILRQLRAAAPSGTTFAAMTLYDTYLGKLPSDGATAEGAVLFLNAYRRANATIVAADARAGFRTADTAGAFDLEDTATVTRGGAPVAANLARMCDLTWSCSPPPINHNIHPNNRGYRVIAQQFERAIGQLPRPRRTA